MHVRTYTNILPMIAVPEEDTDVRSSLERLLSARRALKEELGLTSECDSACPHIRMLYVSFSRATPSCMLLCGKKRTGMQQTHPCVRTA
jgi:hypothetical protein